jgi:hypothetical protein
MTGHAANIDETGEEEKVERRQEEREGREKEGKVQTPDYSS